MRVHNRANTHSLTRLILVCAVLAPATGCGLPLVLKVDAARSAHPDWMAQVVASGLDAIVPLDDIAACGPDEQLAAIIPDCPIEGMCFTPACIAHDVCYTICGTDQAVCDETFFWDMVYRCDAAGFEDVQTRGRCYTLAWIYYEAVSRFGSSYFANSQVISCANGVPVPVAEDGQAARAVGNRMGGPPFLDTDDDLMPDDWEVGVGLDPNDASDAWQDADGDGVPNLGEFTRDTDPYGSD